MPYKSTTPVEKTNYMQDPHNIPFENINVVETKHHFGVRQSSDGIFLLIPKKFTCRDLSNTFIVQAETLDDLNISIIEETHEPIAHASMANSINIGITSMTVSD